MAAVCCVALAVGGGNAAAQLPGPSPFLTPNYAELITRDTLLRQLIQQPARGDERGKQRKRQRPTRRALRRLRYDAKASVTRALRPLLYGKLTDGMDASCCTAVMAEIRQRIDGDAFLDEFQKNVRELGAQRGNLADALGVGAAVLYTAYNIDPGGEPEGVSERGTRRYIKQLARRLASQRRLRRMSDADKQRAAEKMATVAQFAFTFQASNSIFIRQDPSYAEVAEPYLEHNRDMIRRFANEQLDLDLDDVRLTRRGFVER